MITVVFRMPKTEFEKDWNRFKLKQQAFDECECSGPLCTCFMQHENGRALFAQHFLPTVSHKPDQTRLLKII